MLVLVGCGGSGSRGAEQKQARREAATLHRLAAKMDVGGICSHMTSQSRAAWERLAHAQAAPGCRGLTRPQGPLLAAIAAAGRPGAVEVNVSGTRARVRIDGSQRLLLRRERGRWRADMLADPVVNDRVRLSTVCSEAYARLRARPLPLPTRASYARSLVKGAAIFESISRRLLRVPTVAVDRGELTTAAEAFTYTGREMRSMARHVRASQDIITVAQRGIRSLRLTVGALDPAGRTLGVDCGPAMLGGGAAFNVSAANACAQAVRAERRAHIAEKDTSADTTVRAVDAIIARLRRDLARVRPTKPARRLVRMARSSLTDAIAAMHALAAAAAAGDRGAAQAALDRFELQLIRFGIAIGKASTHPCQL